MDSITKFTLLMMYICVTFSQDHDIKDDFTGITRPAFTVTLSGDPASLGGFGHILKFNNVLLNRGNVYNVNTGKFTAPVDGLYQLSITIMSRAGGPLNLGLYKNNKQIMGMYGPAIHGATETANPVLILDKGETIDIRNPLYSRQEVNGHDYTYMSGYYIGK